MKTFSFFCALVCAGALASCSTQLDEMLLTAPTDQVETGNSDPSQFFPVEDDAVKLSGTYHEKALTLLQSIKPEEALVLYDTKITEEQFQEIKTFTDDLVKGLTTQKEVHDKIFNWVHSNVQYAESDNDPYAVFVNKKAICQGYANLLKVMLLSQNIPAVSANGFTWGQGHAWIYAYADGEWYLSDATNNILIAAKDISACGDFKPYFLELAVYEDDNYLVEYSGGELVLTRIKKGDTKFTVPYSANGFIITSFNPETEIPENVKEIYIGKNIEVLSYGGVMGLQLYGKSVEQVHVDPANAYLEEYEGVIYQKQGDTITPYYIPPMTTRIVLKPNKLYSKGVIVGHQYVEEIVFPEGVQVIGDYAIENCPNLKRVYIPEDAVISKKALYNIWQNVEIIREKTETGIHSVTMD